MNSNITFVNEMICKRNADAPDYVICKVSMKKSEMVPFLNSQPGEWVNVEVLKAKASDKLYAKLDTWEPDPAKVHADGVKQVKQTLAKPSDEFSDDIPF